MEQAVSAGRVSLPRIGDRGIALGLMLVRRWPCRGFCEIGYHCDHVPNTWAEWLVSFFEIA